MNPTLAKYLIYTPVTLAKGERVNQYLKVYERMQWASPEEIKLGQNAALGRLVHHAYDNVPYYRRRFEERGIRPQEVQTIEDIQRLPYLTKQDVRDYRKEMIAERGVWLKSDKTTGGSTGQAVTIVKNAEALARERAATWRAYRWAGVEIGDPQARFWGVPLTRRSRSFYQLVDFVANRRRLSAFGVDDETMASYFATLQKFRPAYLYGYVSILSEFAEYLRCNNLEVSWPLRCVITTSEVLDEGNRERLEDVFHCRVFNEYGCGEVGSVAHECEEGSLHVMDENLLVEGDAAGGGDGSSSELVITDLFNYAMPLIRYRIGDFATLGNGSCGCGRGLRVMAGLHGRAYDMLVDAEGRKYHPELIMYLFEELKRKNRAVRQFQVVQRSAEDIEVGLVAEKGGNADVEAEIEGGLREKFGQGCRVEFVYKERIEREESGKLRLVKREFDVPSMGSSSENREARHEGSAAR